MGLCINSGPSWRQDSLNPQHWACKKCIVGMVCELDCHKLKLPHPYCDEICTITEQEVCASKVSSIVSCTKVNKLRIERGTFFTKY